MASYVFASAYAAVIYAIAMKVFLSFSWQKWYSILFAICLPSLMVALAGLYFELTELLGNGFILTVSAVVSLLLLPFGFFGTLTIVVIYRKHFWPKR